ncbi:MAG: sugar phosphate isomerase/epimerase family protein [Promethearchaeota archaeon]|jgi:sugar phosphate isomerase/epimerase
MPKIGGSLIVKSDSQDIYTIPELREFKKVGFDYAELFLGKDIVPNNPLEDKLKTIRNQISILSGHLPDINHKKEEIERCKKFIGFMADLGIKTIVIHLYSPDIQTEENFDLKINTLKYLTETAKNKDITLALENTEEYGATLQRVFERIPDIDFCLDIGHANLFSKENRSIKLINNFEKRLKHIHISDNVGGDSESADLHLPIGEGNIKFKPIFEKLKEINYSGNISLELFKPDLESVKKSIRRLRELF